eukprot:1161518-Pelagomonas_calceolata.AAC.11
MDWEVTNKEAHVPDTGSTKQGSMGVLDQPSKKAQVPDTGSTKQESTDAWYLINQARKHGFLILGRTAIEDIEMKWG